MILNLTDIFLGFKMREIESTKIIVGCKHVRLSLTEIFLGGLGWMRLNLPRYLCVVNM